MKKLLYLFLGLLIVACSSDDSDNGDNNNDINQNLIGTWAGNFIDPENNGVYGYTTLVLNANSTGSVLSVFTGDVDEVYSSTISWSSTATTLTFVFDDGNEDAVATYNFITDDQLRLNQTDGFEVILDRQD